MITAIVAVISVTGSHCTSFVYGSCINIVHVFVYGNCINIVRGTYQFHLKNHCILVVGDNVTNFCLHALECL